MTVGTVYLLVTVATVTLSLLYIKIADIRQDVTAGTSQYSNSKSTARNTLA